MKTDNRPGINRWQRYEFEKADGTVEIGLVNLTRKDKSPREQAKEIAKNLGAKKFRKTKTRA